LTKIEGGVKMASKKKILVEWLREESVCPDDRSPHFGKFCLCAICRPENYCIPDGGGCVECDGPVTECGGPTAKEEEEEEKNRYAYENQQLRQGEETNHDHRPTQK
jgi:hypothetical protein